MLRFSPRLVGCWKKTGNECQMYWLKLNFSTINGASNRYIHMVRHAESEFNIAANHEIHGFMPHVSFVDAELTSNGVNQATELYLKIHRNDKMLNNFHSNMIDDKYSIRNAELVITSPLTRALRTALYALPHDKYNYCIKYEITEQVENTSDIGSSKNQLIDRFPFMENHINELPNSWWWTLNSKSNDEEETPYNDAILLHDYNGCEPARENKHNVIDRLYKFIKWLWSDEQLIYNNIAIFSHSCTIFELEKILNNGYTHNIDMTVNTEVRTYQLPYIDDIIPQSLLLKQK